MSPYEIEILLSLHCSPAELSQAKTPLLDRTLHDFENEGLIAPYKRESGWTTTPKGAAFVDMLCATPLPKQIWVDPRTEKAIGDI